VIAAGGIADARGVRAALALGASAVQVGTAYLLCPETTTSAVHRAALKSRGAEHTALTNVFTVVRHAVSSTRHARARTVTTLRADFSPLWAGQNASGCKEQPAAELTRQLAGV
jgi:nitronate monooxygenase